MSDPSADPSDSSKISDAPFFRPRNLLSAILAITAVAGLYFATSKDVQRGAKLRAAEVAGDIATRVVTAKSGGGGAADLISVPVEVRKLNEYIY